ncbi:MAG: metal-dependent hydrolase [Candidatus Helarchaeota archaeon]
MSKSLAHIIMGSLIATGCYLGYNYFTKKKPSLEGVLGSAALGSFVALFPDIIEPATNPNHRGFFHSVTLGLLLILLTSLTLTSEEIEENIKLLFGVTGSSYLSHLLLDCGTKKGLPLL